MTLDRAAVPPPGDAVFEWDMSSGRVEWSEGVEDVLGHPAAELASVELALRYVHPDDRARALEGVAAFVAERSASWRGRIRVVRGEDDIVVEVTSHRLPQRGAAPQRVIGAVRPVPAAVRASVPALTERQLHVLELVRRGRTNKEIAAALGIGEQGAKRHVSRLLRRLGAANRAALAALAERAGDPER